MAFGAVQLASVLLGAPAAAGGALAAAAGAGGLILGGVALRLAVLATERARALPAAAAAPTAADALLRNAATLDTLIETLPVGVIVADATGRIVRHNAAARELWGVPPETSSIEGYGEWVGWFPETGERIAADQWAMARALRLGETTRGQLVQNQRFGTGERRFYLQNVVPVRDADGRVVGGVGAMLDVTERLAAQEALRESEAKYRALFDHMAMGSCVCRVIYEGGRAVDYVHEEVNRAYEEQTGMRRADVLGRRLSDVIPDPADPARELIEKFGEVARSGRAIRYENEVPSLGRWFEGIAYCPKPGHFATVFLDVTESRRAQAAVREANARLRLALDAARMVAWEYDPATREVVLSDNAEDVLELPRRHGSSDEGFSLIHPDDVADHRLKVETAIADGGSYVSVYRHAHGERTTWLEEHGRAVVDEAGRTRRLVGVVQNVTARQAAEEALRESEVRFRSVLENMSEGVMLFDPAGNLTYQNPGSLRIHGFAPDSEGRIARDALPATWNAWDEQGRPITFDEWPVSRVFRGERFQGQVLRVERAETGRVFHGSYNGSPILDENGRLAMGFITIRDISEEVRAAGALREANERLQEADRRKDEFLAVLSHELRNPLAPIRNSVYVLERAEPGGQQAGRALGVIDRQVGHMTRLIDDLLDVTRISRGKIRLKPERVDLGAVVQETAEDLRTLLRANDLAFDVEASDRPLLARVDRTRIAQVVGNLLQNAAKFTPPGGRVRLRVGVGDGGVGVVRVEDTGIGLEPAILERLFEPFVQAEASLDRTAGGLGLGLALVKGLVEAHGGTVSASSAGRDRGTEITVRVPLEPADSREAAPASPAPAAAATRVLRVLLIEDNADAATTLKEALELNGHAVETARDGPEGLQKARAFDPDVVLCDIGLPGLDGFEVARRLNADPLLHHPCLVALSGYAAPDDLERSRQAGFVRHFAKPPDIAALERTLSEVCLSRH